MGNIGLRRIKMPNGGAYNDEPDLVIEGLAVVALPDPVEIKVANIGGHQYEYSIDLRDIPYNKRWLKIIIKHKWS